MSNLVFYNDGVTTVGAPVAPSDTTITLASGAGALFTPGPTGGQYFVATLSDATTGLTKEIIWVTGVSGDILTVVRAQEGTTALTWSVGDNFANDCTAGTMATLASETALTADKWTTARTLSYTGDVTGSGSVDGSANVAFAMTGVQAAKLTTPRTFSYTGDATGGPTSFDGSANVSSALTLATVNASPGTTGDGTHVTQITTNGKGLVTANTSVAITSAPMLTTARTFSFTGNATGGPTSFDGSANVSTALTLASSVALAGSPTTTTQAVSDSSTKLATTAYVNAVFAGTGWARKAWGSFTFSGTTATLVSGFGISALNYVSTGVWTLVVGTIAGQTGGTLVAVAENNIIGYNTAQVTGADSYTMNFRTYANSTINPSTFVEISIF